MISSPEQVSVEGKLEAIESAARALAAHYPIVQSRIDRTLNQPWYTNVPAARKIGMLSMAVADALSSLGENESISEQTSSVEHGNGAATYIAECIAPNALKALAENASERSPEAFIAFIRAKIMSAMASA